MSIVNGNVQNKKKVSKSNAPTIKDEIFGQDITSIEVVKSEPKLSISLAYNEGEVQSVDQLTYVFETIL